LITLFFWCFAQKWGNSKLTICHDFSKKNTPNWFVPSYFPRVITPGYNLVTSRTKAGQALQGLLCLLLNIPI